MKKAEPQQQHRWLQKLVGEWTSEAEMSMGPDKPVAKTKGSERVRMLGDLWMLAESEGGMPGGDNATMLMTLGYDLQTKRFVGTWAGSMMTHLWIYDGELDASGRILTLDCDGPSMAGDGTLAKYQDIIEVKSDDYRTLSGRVLNPDGTWKHFMTAHYRRKK